MTATAAAPISESQLAANRANAQQSTGPRTQEGKSRTRLNGLRHGLTGQTVFLPDEDRAAYDAHHAQFLAELEPEGVIETHIARQIADEYWRLNRIKAIEDNIFALGIEARAGEFRDDDPEGDAALAQAQTYLDRAREINLLSLYEQRLKRSVLNLHKELARLGQLRRQAEERRKADEAFQQRWPNGSGFSNGSKLPYFPAFSTFEDERPQAQTPKNTSESPESAPDTPPIAQAA